jgi:hypothetical protein
MAMTRTAKLLPTALCALAVCALVALPVAAETYHVNLCNGQSYATRYPPEEASWDADTLLIITETGNWIGVRRAAIDRIEIETELRGFGKRLNATTIFMGRSPNSAQAEETELTPAERQNQLLEQLIGQQQSQPDYTMQQFVEPDALGQGATGGSPVGFTQQSTPPIGVAPVNPQ